MSLTSFLNHPIVKRKFEQMFPFQSPRLKAQIRAEPQTNHYSMMGTAFDYLLRFHIKRLNPNAVRSKWIAELAVESILKDKIVSAVFQKSFDNEVSPKGFRQTTSEKISEGFDQAKSDHIQFIRDGVVSDKLLKSCIFLAKLDPIIRAGWFLFNPKVLDSTDDGDIKDLRNLISIVDFSLFESKDVSVLNPTFGKASSLIGSADADLIIGDTLIDIKTTKKLTITRSHINQIIGYYLLTKIGGVDKVGNHKINKIGLYFSRYGKLYEIPVSFIEENPKLSKFMDWFETKARKTFPESKFSRPIRFL